MNDPRYLLVDLGGTRVRVAVGHYAGFLDRREERTAFDGGPAETERQIVRMALDALAASKVDPLALERLVISSPGPLDPTTGVVYGAPNMPGWEEVHLKEDLEAALKLPVITMNDANAAALGEYTAGAGRGHRHLVYLTISTGIGAGVIVDGELLEGAAGSAGELGHMTIDRYGPVCKCGNVGCLEVLASGTSIARRFQERLQAGETSTVSDFVGERNATAADVYRGAQEGDKLAAAVFEDAAAAVGTGVVNCIHIFNPELVILGGGVTQAGELFFGPVRRMVQQHAMPELRRAVRVVPAGLGDDAGLYGALARGIALTAHDPAAPEAPEIADAPPPTAVPGRHRGPLRRP